MINKVMNTIHSISMFIDDIKHISISQWDVENKEEGNNNSNATPQ